MVFNRYTELIDTYFNNRCSNIFAHPCVVRGWFYVIVIKINNYSYSYILLRLYYIIPVGKVHTHFENRRGNNVIYSKLNFDTFSRLVVVSRFTKYTTGKLTFFGVFVIFFGKYSTHNWKLSLNIRWRGLHVVTTKEIDISILCRRNRTKQKHIFNANKTCIRFTCI